MARQQNRVGISTKACKLVILLFAISLVAIVIALVMAVWGFDHDTLWFEIGKLVAQLGLITGFGAIVTLLVHEFQRDQEEAQKRVAAEQRRAETRQEWLRSLLTRTSTAYTDLKQARRALQAAVQSNGTVEGGGRLRADVYYDQLPGISEVQADFENLYTEVRSYVSQDAPQGAETEVAKDLQLIERRLSVLITEWKNHPQPTEGVPPSTVAMTELEDLRLFLARSDDQQRFDSGFGKIKGAYKCIERAIWKDLTAPDALVG